MMLGCSRGEELRKGQQCGNMGQNISHMIKPPCINTKMRETLLCRNVHVGLSIFTPVIGICIGAQAGRRGGHEGEEEAGRWGRNGRRGGREACGRRRGEGEGCGNSRDEAMKTSGRLTRRRTEEAGAARRQSKERDRRGELAARRRSPRGRPRRAWRWG